MTRQTRHISRKLQDGRSGAGRVCSKSSHVTSNDLVCYLKKSSMLLSDTSCPPPRKRLRQENSVTPSERRKDEPRLFVPFRALGLVTNHIPFVLQTRSHKGATDGPRIHLLTCLGRAWALWEGAKMGLLFVGRFITVKKRF